MDISIIAGQGLAIRDRVEELEKVCLDKEQVDCPVAHYFGPGVYIREVSVPAGTFAIGHRQKVEHLCMFTKGKVNFIEQDGSVSLLEAPMTFTSPPGRKIGLVLEDMVWLNIYPTEETDIEVLEDMYLDKSAYFLDHQKNKIGCDPKVKE